MVSKRKVHSRADFEFLGSILIIIPIIIYSIGNFFKNEFLAAIGLISYLFFFFPIASSFWAAYQNLNFSCYTLSLNLPWFRRSAFKEIRLMIFCIPIISLIVTILMYQILDIYKDFDKFIIFYLQIVFLCSLIIFPSFLHISIITRDLIFRKVESDFIYNENLFKEINKQLKKKHIKVKLDNKVENQIILEKIGVKIFIDLLEFHNQHIQLQFKSITTEKNIYWVMKIIDNSIKRLDKFTQNI